MRVIAGTYRSRQLVSPRGTLTRPTSDRLRETLFNILAPRLAGCRFVDLYAGTGAVGIEAISRGASHVWFSEKAEAAIAALRANLAALKISHGYTLEDRGTGALLDRLGKLVQAGQGASAVDIVYLDPPYEAAAEYEGTLSLLGSVRGRQMLAADALVVAEHSSKATLAPRYGALTQTRLLKQGDAALSFYGLVEAATDDAAESEDAQRDAMHRLVNQILGSGNEAFARKMVGHVRVNLVDDPIIKEFNEAMRKQRLRKVN